MIFEFERTGRLTPLPAGVLRGTTKIAGLPDVSVKRRVQVFKSENAHGQIFPTTEYVSWMWSSEQGDWEFSGLDPSLKYHVIAYDHTGQYDPVIKMNLVPTVD